MSAVPSASSEICSVPAATPTRACPAPESAPVPIRPGVPAGTADSPVRPRPCKAMTVSAPAPVRQSPVVKMDTSRPGPAVIPSRPAPPADPSLSSLPPGVSSPSPPNTASLPGMPSRLAPPRQRARRSLRKDPFRVSFPPAIAVEDFIAVVARAACRDPPRPGPSRSRRRRRCGDRAATGAALPGVGPGAGRQVVRPAVGFDQGQPHRRRHGAESGNPHGSTVWPPRLAGSARPDSGEAPAAPRIQLHPARVSSRLARELQGFCHEPHRSRTFDAG